MVSVRWIWLAIFRTRRHSWATVVVQGGGALYLFSRAARTGLLRDVSATDFRPSGRAFVNLTRLGFPASLNMLTVAVGFFVITWFMGRFSTAAVAAYGIATRIEQTVMLPVMGLNIATMALVARNFGARRIDRVIETFRVAICAGLVITLICTVCVWLLAPGLLRIFTSDPAVASVGARYLRIEALVFCAYIILYISVSALQGLQRPFYPLGIGLYRQLAAPVVIFPLLAFKLQWGLPGIWWGIVPSTGAQPSLPFFM